MIKGRHQWQQEKESLEKKLTDLKEKVAELKGKLKLQELKSRARSPSVMPKEERVAAVDSMMEVESMMEVDSMEAPGLPSTVRARGSSGSSSMQS